MTVKGAVKIGVKSLNRPFFIMGVDRRLFFLLLGFCVPIAYSARFSLEMDIITIIIFSLGYIAALLITRADPEFLQIYIRHIKYRKYYAAQAGIHAPIKFLKPSVPLYQGKTGFL